MAHAVATMPNFPQPIPPVSLDHAYWKNKLPRSFQLYIDRLSRAMIRVQPSNGAEFAAVLMEQLLAQRTRERNNLPEVSYLMKLKAKVDKRGYGGPVGHASNVATTPMVSASEGGRSTATARSTGTGFSNCSSCRNREQQSARSQNTCSDCVSQELASKAGSGKAKTHMYSTEVQTQEPRLDVAVQVSFGNDMGVQVSPPETPGLTPSPAPPSGSSCCYCGRETVSAGGESRITPQINTYSPIEPSAGEPPRTPMQPGWIHCRPKDPGRLSSRSTKTSSSPMSPHRSSPGKSPPHRFTPPIAGFDKRCHCRQPPLRSPDHCHYCTPVRSPQIGSPAHPPPLQPSPSPPPPENFQDYRSEPGPCQAVFRPIAVDPTLDQGPPQGRDQVLEQVVLEVPEEGIIIQEVAETPLQEKLQKYICVCNGPDQMQPVAADLVAKMCCNHVCNAKQPRHAPAPPPPSPASVLRHRPDREGSVTSVLPEDSLPPVPEQLKPDASNIKTWEENQGRQKFPGCCCQREPRAPTPTPVAAPGGMAGTLGILVPWVAPTAVVPAFRPTSPEACPHGPVMGPQPFLRHRCTCLTHFVFRSPQGEEQVITMGSPGSAFTQRPAYGQILSCQGGAYQGPHDDQRLAFQRAPDQDQSYRGPAYQGPTYQGPTYQGPAYPGPAYPGSAYQGPAYQGPAYQGPAYQGPAYQGPTYGQRYPGPGNRGYQVPEVTNRYIVDDGETCYCNHVKMPPQANTQWGEQSEGQDWSTVVQPSSTDPLLDLSSSMYQSPELSCAKDYPGLYDYLFDFAKADNGPRAFQPPQAATQATNYPQTCQHCFPTRPPVGMKEDEDDVAKMCRRCIDIAIADAQLIQYDSPQIVDLQSNNDSAFSCVCKSPTTCPSSNQTTPVKPQYTHKTYHEPARDFTFQGPAVPCHSSRERGTNTVAPHETAKPNTGHDPSCTCACQSSSSRQGRAQASTNTPTDYLKIDQDHCGCCPNSNRNSPYTLVTELPDNASRPSSTVPEAAPAVNVSVNVQVESAFDSEVFIDEVKRHITSAVEEMRASQREALQELKESATFLPMLIEPHPTDSLDKYCCQHREERRAEREAAKSESAKTPEPVRPEPVKPVYDDGLCECRRMSASRASQSQQSRSVSRSGRTVDPRDASLYPRRPSEEDFTSQGLVFTNSASMLYDY